MKWFWLSFGDTSTGKWLGGCWIDIPPGLDPIVESHKRGLNPGGQVVVMEREGSESPPLRELGRLLQKSDFSEEELERI